MMTATNTGNPISFQKAESGLITVTSSWTSKYDVDLVALYELSDPFVKEEERKSAVQALGKMFGRIGRAPYILLDGDRRSGGQEQLKINLPRAHNLNRVLVFAYIYGPGTWKDVRDAQVVVHHPTERTDHTFRLQGTSRQEKNAKSCALVDLVSDGNGGLTLTPLGKYFDGTHREIDHYYGFGIRWGFGSK